MPFLFTVFFLNHFCLIITHCNSLSGSTGAGSTGAGSTGAGSTGAGSTSAGSTSAGSTSAMIKQKW